MKTVMLTLQLSFEDSIPTSLIHTQVREKVKDLTGLRSSAVRGMPYYMPLMAPSGAPSVLGIRMSALSNEQAILHHRQDLNRLHDRGGLNPLEALSVVQCTGYQKLPIPDALNTLYSTLAGVMLPSELGTD